MRRTQRWLAGTLVAGTVLSCGGASAVPPPRPDSAEQPSRGETPASSAEPPEAEPAPAVPAAEAPAQSAAAVAEEPPAATAAPTSTAQPSEPAPASSSSARPAPTVPGANLTIGSLTVDGVEVRSLSCRTAGGGLGGLLGSLSIAAGFGQRKAPLDACAPNGQTETEVRWQQRGGKMRDVRAVGANGQRNACVERALTGAAAPQDAECAAIVVHGR